MSTPAEPQPVTIESLSELVRLAELREIVTYRLVAERETNDIPSIAEAEQEIQVQVRGEPELLETRFALRITAPNVKYLVDLGTIYRFEAPVAQMRSELVAEFLTQVGVMAAFPYLREGVSGLAARMGAEIPVLGLLRRGEVSFGLPGEHEQAPEHTEG